MLIGAAISELKLTKNLQKQQQKQKNYRSTVDIYLC